MVLPADVIADAQVMLVAGDTFRAAATEQLGEWARRSGSQLEAADPARIAAGSARPDKVLSAVCFCPLPSRFSLVHITLESDELVALQCPSSS